MTQKVPVQTTNIEMMDILNDVIENIFKLKMIKMVKKNVEMVIKYQKGKKIKMVEN